jgi:hypothetical protein
MANPDCSRRSCLWDDGPYFWSRGHAASRDDYPDNWHDNSNPYGIGWSKSCHASPGGATGWGYQSAVAGTPVEGFYLFACSLTSQSFSSNAPGWWSPSLPCIGGGGVDLSL